MMSVASYHCRHVDKQSVQVTGAMEPCMLLRGSSQYVVIARSSSNRRRRREP